MSKKSKKEKSNQLFDKFADITTKDSKYHIRKARVFTYSKKTHTSYYGKMLTINSPEYNQNCIHEIREIYLLDDNRLRLRLRKYWDANKFKTIEKNDDNSKERKLAVIEYDHYTEFIHSIGDIKEIDSDLNPSIKKSNRNVKILELVMPRKEEKDKIKEHI